MRSAQPELIQRVCVLFNGTQLSNHPINIKPSSALSVRACVCVSLILFSVFRALGRVCSHEFLRRLRDLLPWEEVSYGGLPP